MAKTKFKPHKQVSTIKQVLGQKKSVSDLENTEDFLLSFRHLDKTQGDSLYIWEQNAKLAHSIDVLAGYCQRPLKEQMGDKFMVYGDFPPADKTIYKIPTQVPEDAKWARIHITGEQIVAGHVVKNVFYVVFLDPEHKFYISQLKHT